MLTSRILHFVLLLAYFAGGLSAAEPKLDMNDVSWLWPVPQTASELATVISMDSLRSEDGKPVWSDEQFADLIRTVEGDASKLGTSQIGLEDSFRDKATWKIVAMRVDPTAPGGHTAIVDAFSSSPQIRLIVQPVDVRGGRAIVHDVAVHMVYDFLRDGVDAKGRKLPDRAAFKKIVKDLEQLKSISEQGGAATTGKPLGVHPGLKANVDGLHSEIRKFLGRHLSSDKLTAMAIMGLDGKNPDPWMFLALAKFPPGANRFGPVPFLPLQMIDFRTLKVSPAPIVNNRAPITNRLVIPAAERLGVSTAALFNRTIDKNALASIGNDGTADVTDGEAKNRDIPDIVADPKASHFFNTDCVSCHTESTRRIRLGFSPGNFAFRVDGSVPPVDPEVLPKDDWNLRNFGWFPPHAFIGGGPTVATATQRTANETAEVVAFIEREYGER